jgi:hypothetical protein
MVNLFGGANFMVRRQQRLSALQVAKLSKPGLHGDGGGLTLQITTTGAKSWLFRYMMAGKPFGMGLGPTHTVSLAEARQKALDARKLLIEGINPLVVKRQNRIAGALASAKMMTFDQCAEAYILAHKAGWKNAKHADQWTNTLNTYASPVFGHLPVAEIDTGLVVKCLHRYGRARPKRPVAARSYRVSAGVGLHQRLPHRRESCALERPPGQSAGDHQQVQQDEAPSIATVAAHWRVHVGPESA